MFIWYIFLSIRHNLCNIEKLLTLVRDTVNMEISLMLDSAGRTAFEDAVSTIQGEINCLSLGMTYVTKAGLDRFRIATNSKIQEREKRWLVSIDGGITQPAALRELMNDPDSAVKVHNGRQALRNRTLSTYPKFHPKAIWVEKDSGYDLLVGSTNLTQRAIESNWEAGFLLKNITEDDGADRLEPLLDSWWDEAWSSAVTPTEEFIEDYSEVRNSYIDNTPPEQLRRGGLDTERDLSNAELLWSEVETTMGYNDHQIEVPRRCLNFFTGKSGDVKEGDKVKVTFVYSGNRFEERSVRAHPNQMCRVNLPNRLGKTFDITRYSAIFEFVEEGEFEISLIPDDESEMELEPLRRESQNQGQVLSMEQKDREYGWL